MTDIIEKRKIYSPAEQETFSFSDEIKRSLVSKSKFVKKIEEIEKWLQNSNKNIKENDEKLKKLEKKYEKLTKYSGKTSEPNGKKNSSIKEVYSKLLKHLNKMISINQKSKNSQTMTLKIKDSETELKFLKEEEKRLNLEISSKSEVLGNFKQNKSNFISTKALELFSRTPSVQPGSNKKKVMKVSRSFYIKH